MMTIEIMITPDGMKVLKIIVTTIALADLTFDEIVTVLLDLTCNLTLDYSRSAS